MEGAGVRKREPTQGRGRQKQDTGGCGVSGSLVIGPELLLEKARLAA